MNKKKYRIKKLCNANHKEFFIVQKKVLCFWLTFSDLDWSPEWTFCEYGGSKYEYLDEAVNVINNIKSIENNRKIISSYIVEEYE